MKRIKKRKRIACIFKKYERLGLRDKRLDVFSVCKRIQGSCRTMSESKDLFAMWELVRLLRMEKRSEELEVFKRIYMQDGVSMSVLKQSRSAWCDERTLYRHLAYIEQRYEQIRDSLD